MTVHFMFPFPEYDKRAAVYERVILIGNKETMQKQCTLPLTWKTFDVEFLWCYEIWVLLFHDLSLFFCNLNMWYQHVSKLVFHGLNPQKKCGEYSRQCCKRTKHDKYILKFFVLTNRYCWLLELQVGILNFRFSGFCVLTILM